MKITLLLAITCACALLWASQVDDKLGSDARMLIARLDGPNDSEAYLFLSGFYAHADDKPSDVGRALLETSRKDESGDVSGAELYDDAKKIPRPSGDLFCPVWEPGCLDRLFTESFDIDAMRREHKVLLQRLAVFHQFDEYQTLAKPTLREIYPPYHYVAAAERIRVLAAIAAFKEGDTAAAIDALSKQLVEIRSSLALQDNLIGKLIFLMKFSEVIDVLSIIHSQTGQPSMFIPLLTPAEKDFTRVVAREFGLSYYGFLEIDRDPGFFQESGSVPGWMVRVLYKPNMTINAIAPQYLEWEHMMELTSAEFAVYLENGNRYVPSSSRIRNYAGSALIAMPANFDEYIARFKDLDAKLTLFNQRYHYQAALDELKNPFYPDESAEISASQGCFRGPLEDVRYLRCIRL